LITVYTLDRLGEALGEKADAEDLAAGRVPLPAEVHVVDKRALQVGVPLEVVTVQYVAALDGHELAILRPRERTRGRKAQVGGVGRREVERHRRQEVLPFVPGRDRITQCGTSVHLESVDLVACPGDQAQAVGQRHLGHQVSGRELVVCLVGTALCEGDYAQHVVARAGDAAVEDLLGRQLANTVAQRERVDGIRARIGIPLGIAAQASDLEEVMSTRPPEVELVVVSPFATVLALR
jgi:hypothetical protein